jgi:hypothetical protein
VRERVPSSASRIPEAATTAMVPNKPLLPSFLLAGWVDLAEAAFKEFDHLVPGWRLIQVKEKWAALRISAHPLLESDEATVAKFQEVIAAARIASLETCDVCGAPGDVFGPGHPEWTDQDELTRTRCDRHRRNEPVEAVLIVGRARLRLAQAQGDPP